MIVGFAELLQERRSAGGALGAFTCYDLETAHGVLAAAAELDTGVVLLIGNASFAGRAACSSSRRCTAPRRTRRRGRACSSITPATSG